MALTRTQTIALQKKEQATIEPISESGNPGVIEMEFKLKQAPEGDWHMRALTNLDPLELPAAAIQLDIETLIVKAAFSNYQQFPLEITGIAVDVV